MPFSYDLSPLIIVKTPQGQAFGPLPFPLVSPFLSSLILSFLHFLYCFSYCYVSYFKYLLSMWVVLCEGSMVLSTYSVGILSIVEECTGTWASEDHWLGLLSIHPAAQMGLVLFIVNGK